MAEPRKHSLLNNIQGLRGLAVLAVVLSHLLVIEGKYAGDRILPHFFQTGFAGVDLFFAISGFVMVYVAWANPAGFKTAFVFLFSRVGRIYPLYWLVSLAVLGLWLVRPDMVFSSSGGHVDLVRSFLLWPGRSFPLLQVGWTLIHEMYFYLVFTLLLLLPQKWRLAGLLLWAGGIIVFFATNKAAHGPLLTLISNPLTLEFIGGALAALVWQHWPGRFWLLALVAGGAFMGAAMVFADAYGPSDFWTSAVRPICFTPGVALLVYGAAGAETAGRRFFPILSWLGTQSYSLYLTHVLSLSAAGRIWALIARPGPWDNFLAMPVLLAIAIAAGQLVHVYAERPLLETVKTWRRSLFA